MVALMVSECVGVGLRTPDVPALFYTGMGLLWAMSSRREPGLLARLQRNPITRVGGSVLLVFGGVAAMLSMQQDFLGARASFRVRQDLREEKFEQAVKDATMAIDRLNPQRALENWYHLAEAYASIGKQFHDVAMEREAKAQQSEIPDPILLELARRGRLDSDQFCQSAGAALKELVHRSPGYINHGMIDFWTHLIQSNNALSRGNQAEATRYLDSARAAAERELFRQPFDPQVALAFARAQAGGGELPRLIEALARPLRYHRVSGGYAQFLQELASRSTLSESFIASAMTFDVVSPSSANELDALASQTKSPRVSWAPEARRLASVVYYSQGNYEQAKRAAESASEIYDRIGISPSMGAAACLEELADYTFVNQPHDAQQAITYVLRAISYAPQTEAGRAFQADVKHRLIDYHLAAGDESAAEKLLRETGPKNVSDEAVQQELGVRYRQMTQSLLLQRHGEGLIPKSAKELLPEMQAWVQRAIALNPRDGLAWYLASDLAFQEGNDQATVHHLRESLRLGLPIEEAIQFLSLARDRRPDSASLNELWEVLQSVPARNPSNFKETGESRTNRTANPNG